MQHYSDLGFEGMVEAQGLYRGADEQLQMTGSSSHVAPDEWVLVQWKTNPWIERPAHLAIDSGTWWVLPLVETVRDPESQKREEGKRSGGSQSRWLSHFLTDVIYNMRSVKMWEPSASNPWLSRALKLSGLFPATPWVCPITAAGKHQSCYFSFSLSHWLNF